VINEWGQEIDLYSSFLKVRGTWESSVCLTLSNDAAYPFQKALETDPISLHAGTTGILQLPWKVFTIKGSNIFNQDKPGTVQENNGEKKPWMEGRFKY
jgi:hypothetical protein